LQPFEGLRESHPYSWGRFNRLSPGMKAPIEKKRLVKGCAKATLFFQ